MKKWILGAVAFAALFWAAHLFDHRKPATAALNVPDPYVELHKTVAPPTTVAPVVAKPAPVKVQHKRLPMLPPPPPAPVPFRCFIIFECIRPA